MTGIFIEPETETDHTDHTRVRLPKDVTLDWYQLIPGAVTGVMRQLKSWTDDRKDRYPTNDPMAPHVWGGIWEQVCSVGLDKAYKPTIDVFSTEADIGDEEEARGRVILGNQLVLKEKDFREPLRSRRFWLIVGRPPKFKIMGWCRPSEVQKYLTEGKPDELLQPCASTQKEKDAPPTRWFVPHMHLKAWIPYIPKTWEKPEAQEKLPLKVKTQIPPIEPVQEPEPNC